MQVQLSSTSSFVNVYIVWMFVNVDLDLGAAAMEHFTASLRNRAIIHRLRGRPCSSVLFHHDFLRANLSALPAGDYATGRMRYAKVKRAFSS